MDICTIILKTPLEPLRISATEAGLREVHFLWRGGKGFPQECANRKALQFAERAAEQLEKYFAGGRVKFDVPLDLTNATDFQKAVWKACRKIGYGTICSYSRLSELAGYPGAARAVGTSMAANRFAIIVPCHRIVKASGEIGNYGYGCAMKDRLLRLEGVQLENGRVTSGRERRF